MGFLFMKAISFIEVVGNIHRDNIGKHISTNEIVEFASKILKLQKFYSQPFDIGMLVPPFAEPGEYDEPILKMKWREAEDRVLFDIECNWNTLDEIVEMQRNEITGRIRTKVWKIQSSAKGVVIRFAGDNPDTAGCITLNEFVSDMYRHSRELHWKQSIVDKYFNH